MPGVIADEESHGAALVEILKIALENQIKIGETLDLIKREFDKFEEDQRDTLTLLAFLLRSVQRATRIDDYGDAEVPENGRGDGA